MLDNMVSLYLLALGLWVIWVLLAEVGVMARARGRSPWAWCLLSIALSPFGSMFVLWAFFPLNART